MRTIPEAIIAEVNMRMNQLYPGAHRITSPVLRNEYKHGSCFHLATALHKLNPDLLQTWVLCEQPQEVYDEHQDWLSGDRSTPEPDKAYGHAFVMLSDEPRFKRVLDIEGLRPLANMRMQSVWCRLEHCFQVPPDDFTRWTESEDPDLDRVVAEVLFDYYLEEYPRS